MKTGGRLVIHARYYWLLLEESGLARRLFGAIGSGVFLVVQGSWLMYTQAVLGNPNGNPGYNVWKGNEPCPEEKQ